MVHTELDTMMKKHSGADLVGLVNEHLVLTLTKNLSNMDHFSKREMVSENSTSLQSDGVVVV